MSTLKLLIFLQRLPVSLRATDISNQLRPMQVQAPRYTLSENGNLLRSCNSLHVSRECTVLTTLASDAGSHLQC